MRLGSLFDGIGGGCLAAIHAGIKPIWSSEIDKNCCMISKLHFPNVKQLGDITKISGAEIEPVDIIFSTSPCTSLSIAGKKEGLKGESGLFTEGIRIAREMQKATGGKYPRYFVWENVPGAFSSNRGADFKAVLEDILQTKISMPRSGKWANAGLVRSRNCEVAWRVLDAQYFGVPQRRKRIFLVADFRGQCARKILFESKSLQGNTNESKKEKQNTTTNAKDSIRTSIYDMTHANDVIRKVNGGVVQTLTARMGTGGNQIPLIQKYYCIAGNTIGRKPGNGGNGTGFSENLSYTLTATDHHAVAYTVDVDTLRASGGVVRKLTPLECERLQGLPDNWTFGISDSARYKAIGNGMAQPCADYVIKRIVEEEQENEQKNCRNYT